MHFWDQLYRPDAKPGILMIPILTSAYWIQLLPARTSTLCEPYIQLSAQPVNNVLIRITMPVSGRPSHALGKSTSQMLIQHQVDLCIRL